MEVNDLATTADPTAGTGAAVAVQPAGFINRLKTALGKISSSLMSSLSKYMRFQSWSISGGLTGGVPWLTGTVTLQLTFGP